MSSSFTPTNVVDMSKEKDWPASLGMLDWDSTNIVFTKRSLIEFLKYTGTTVDPNFTNIAKLPRYAKFGKIAVATEDAPVPTVSQSIADSTSASDVSSDFKPTRRVRTVPGGPHSDIFGPEDQGDALSLAPSKESAQATSPAARTEVNAEDSAKEDGGIKFESTFKPTRRVRTTPGGPSSMANFWDPAEAEEFKPTRRVRQIPGGQDNINGIF
ncbi:hypothetical protein Hypma_008852 [Hypsizygus marmoreus]|uniref:Uncharacterized protein n=1 Tax=Hypsizygus marmoreus TaxID=39966 RepID=A0A369JS16_HYPMA|nr:hypothetical protein Hypma_008852 [Hypsizygus marmoreus]